MLVVPASPEMLHQGVNMEILVFALIVLVIYLFYKVRNIANKNDENIHLQHVITFWIEFQDKFYDNIKLKSKVSDDFIARLKNKFPKNIRVMIEHYNDSFIKVKTWTTFKEEIEKYNEYISRDLEISIYDLDYHAIAKGKEIDNEKFLYINVDYYYGDIIVYLYGDGYLKKNESSAPIIDRVAELLPNSYLFRLDADNFEYLNKYAPIPDEWYQPSQYFVRYNTIYNREENKTLGGWRIADVIWELSYNDIAGNFLPKL